MCYWNSKGTMVCVLYWEAVFFLEVKKKCYCIMVKRSWCVFFVRRLFFLGGEKKCVVVMVKKVLVCVLC